MDSTSYVYISLTIHGMWMIYVTFERGGPKFSNTTARALASQRDVRRFQNESLPRSRRERRLCASVLASEISWSHTLRLFLVGVHKRSSLCTISTNNFGRPKKPYRNCGELSDAKHSSSGAERIHLPPRYYPCGRRAAHWTFINFIVSIHTYLLTYLLHGAGSFLRS